jgi:N12 class adenine-specific DNA methylase
LISAEERDAEGSFRGFMAESNKDEGVTFEQTGVDYLFVDEAHLYKNKAFVTHMQGVGGKGSQRAEDLDLKLHQLWERHGERVTRFATATHLRLTNHRTHFRTRLSRNVNWY